MKLQEKPRMWDIVKRYLHYNRSFNVLCIFFATKLPVLYEEVRSLIVFIGHNVKAEDYKVQKCSPDTESQECSIRESPPQFENRIMARVYVRSITRSTMYQKAPFC